MCYADITVDGNGGYAIHRGMTGNGHHVALELTSLPTKSPCSVSDGLHNEWHGDYQKDGVRNAETDDEGVLVHFHSPCEYCSCKQKYVAKQTNTVQNRCDHDDSCGNFAGGSSCEVALILVRSVVKFYWFGREFMIRCVTESVTGNSKGDRFHL